MPNQITLRLNALDQAAMAAAAQRLAGRRGAQFAGRMAVFRAALAHYNDPSTHAPRDSDAGAR